MAPANAHYAIGLFFWNAGRLLGVIVIMRSAMQGPLLDRKRNDCGNFTRNFQTALGRLRLSEREHTVRVALEQFMRRVSITNLRFQRNRIVAAAPGA